METLQTTTPNQLHYFKLNKIWSLYQFNKASVDFKAVRLYARLIKFIDL